MKLQAALFNINKYGLLVLTFEFIIIQALCECDQKIATKPNWDF